MADGVDITAGSGTTISTDDRSHGHVQRFSRIGATSLTTGQAAPTNSAANIVAARDTRQRLVLVNHGSVDVFVGPATVTTANGLKIPPGASLTLYTTVAVQGITASGTGSIHYAEEYE